MRYTGKISTGPNQQPSREIKNSVASSKKYFKLYSNVISSQHTRRYPPNYPMQTTPNAPYTSSPYSPTQNQ